jgi:hypothetical protein
MKGFQLYHTGELSADRQGLGKLKAKQARELDVLAERLLEQATAGRVQLVQTRAEGYEFNYWFRESKPRARR